MLDDGGFVLPDSGAILQYLDARYPETPLTPADPQLRGRALWFEAYMQNFFREVVRTLFHQRVFAQMRGEPPDLAAIDIVLIDLAPRYLDYLEGEIAGPWLVGDAMTVADISFGANLVLYHYRGEGLPADRYPALSGHFRDLATTPVFVGQLEAELPFAKQMGFSQATLAA